jgi:hypothetical protein
VSLFSSFTVVSIYHCNFLDAFWRLHGISSTFSALAGMDAISCPFYLPSRLCILRLPVGDDCMRPETGCGRASCAHAALLLRAQPNYLYVELLNIALGANPWIYCPYKYLLNEMQYLFFCISTGPREMICRVV